MKADDPVVPNVPVVAAVENLMGEEAWISISPVLWFDPEHDVLVTGATYPHAHRARELSYVLFKPGEWHHLETTQKQVLEQMGYVVEVRRTMSGTWLLGKMPKEGA